MPTRGKASIFQPGDPVVLQEGESPVMMVEKVLLGVAYVTWFDKTHVLHKGHFPEGLLKRPQGESR